MKYAWRQICFIYLHRNREYKGTTNRQNELMKQPQINSPPFRPKTLDCRRCQRIFVPQSLSRKYPLQNKVQSKNMFGILLK